MSEPYLTSLAMPQVLTSCVGIARLVTSLTLALDVVKWFNNHSQALDKLQIEQIITYDSKSWSLILPVITRWTAHYLSLT
jgi:hypothetical protein